MKCAKRIQIGKSKYTILLWKSPPKNRDRPATTPSPKVDSTLEAGEKVD